ncbi:serine/threonine-protein kinase pelle [Helicoverpa armigera]|uniref:serine/threonine-protein kinase pelle n=1 Tax=Helicoverpa armigera TaxID=29058 RepID=UPI00308325F2
MYTNELPYEINRELCRLLDFENLWKELAGIWMEYSPFEITYMEQTAHGQERSPSEYLLQKWGQGVHKVEELFLYLYKMQYLDALVCLKPVVRKDLHRKIIKLKKSLNAMEKENEMDKGSEQTNGSINSIPWIVKQIERGEKLPNTSSLQHFSLMNNDSMNFNEISTETYGISTGEITTRQVFAIPKISYKELEEATDNWSEHNLLGSGGFGQVFKGEWKHLTVAVKRLHNDRSRELLNELTLNNARHDNILPLYGYSLGDSDECVLVCQFMPGGSLLQRLKGRTHPPLTWLQRYNIMHGVARGLLHLHTMPDPIIHGDIKPANILLDGNLTPKIGDFGAATVYSNKSNNGNVPKSKKPNGSWPYLPGEYLRDREPDPAVDVFSFGVVMFEVATALRVIDVTRPQKLLLPHIKELLKKDVDMATLEDPVLRGSMHTSPAMCRAFIDFGLHCTKTPHKLRPTMLDVFKELNEMELPVND